MDGAPQQPTAESVYEKYNLELRGKVDELNVAFADFNGFKMNMQAFSSLLDDLLPQIKEIYIKYFEESSRLGFAVREGSEKHDPEDDFIVAKIESVKRHVKQSEDMLVAQEDEDPQGVANVRSQIEYIKEKIWRI